MELGSVPAVLTLLLAAGIIFIGVRELIYPAVGAQGFGVPLIDPRDGDLLAVKAARDIASGVLVLALLGLGDRRSLAYAIGALSLIPIMDGLIVLRHAGWEFKPVIAIHWGTAVFMLVIIALLRKEIQLRE